MPTIDNVYAHFLDHLLVSTDSRRIEENCIFFALKGENFNGNLYATKALEMGAAFAIVDELVNSDDPRIILVSNVLKSLQDFANKYRKAFSIPFIAITGSNGKTTTKELLAEVLGSTFNVHYTKGNFNNHIGVPLTLLQLRKDHELAIIEMGANHINEIDTLCKIAEPTHGIITNIGKAHLEGFGGMDGVRKAKGELYNFLAFHKGVIFFNQSESSTKELIESRKIKPVVFSKESRSHGFVDLDLIEEQDSLSMHVHFYNDDSLRVDTQLQGSFNLGNIVSAICIGIYFHVSNDKIKQAIESYIPKNNRSQIVRRKSNKFLLDAYNANPSSMEVAIENFHKIEHENKIMILGDMYELGEYAQSEHKRLAKLANKLDFKKVIYVGKLFPKNDFENVEQLKDWFEQQEFQNCFFLIKGSRGVALERLILE